LFVTFAIFTMKYQGVDKTKALPLARTWILAFIWPAVYFTYLVVINFIPMPASIFMWAGSGPNQLHDGHYYVSVYGILTNYNPKCLIAVWDTTNQIWAYQADDGGLVNDYNNSGWGIRALIVPIVLVFYILEVFILTYINNRLNKVYLPYKPYKPTH
jgi:hypothetical protein